MNPPVTNQPTATKLESGQSFFLSEILSAKIILHEKKIGRLRDLVIKENGAVPHVTHLLISLPFGMSAVVPWEKIGAILVKEKKIVFPNILK